MKKVLEKTIRAAAELSTAAGCPIQFRPEEINALLAEIDSLRKALEAVETRRRQMRANNFDVLKEMSIQNLDIRVAGAGNITQLQKTKVGGLVTVGVDSVTIDRLLRNDKVVFALLVADGEQFDRIKAELGREP